MYIVYVSELNASLGAQYSIHRANGTQWDENAFSSFPYYFRLNAEYGEFIGVTPC